MLSFLDALRHDFNPFAAFRTALFKTSRSRIQHHELRGYVAPWGAGLGGRLGYRQARQTVTKSLGSGNTGNTLLTQSSGAAGSADETWDSGEQPVLPEIAGSGISSGDKGANVGMGQTAPSGQDEESEEGTQDEKPIVVEEDDTAGTGTPLPPLTMTSPGMRFAMVRSTAAVAVADTADLTVAGTAALYFESDGLTTSGNTTIKRTQSGRKGNYSYSVDNYGSYNDADAEWYTETGNRGSASFWVGADGLGDYERVGGRGSSEYEATTTDGISDTLYLIDIGKGDKLYMGGANYAGTIRVVAGTENAWLGSYLPEETAYNMGSLAGSGAFTLVAHGPAETGGFWGAPLASIYSFNDNEASEDWFSGTVKFGASDGGNIQLNIGTEGASTAWENVVFDLTRTAGPWHNTSTGDTAASVILNLQNSVSIAGLQGGDDSSTVTSNASSSIYTLSFGAGEGSDYTYNGTFNGDYFTSTSQMSSASSLLNLHKTGENTQTFTRALDAGIVNILTVDGGTLRLDSDADDTNGYNRAASALYVYVNEGGTLKAGSLEVTGTQVGEAEFSVAGGTVEVSGNIAVSYDAAVSAGGEVTAANMTAGNILAVDGTGTTLDVAGHTSALAALVSHGAHITTGSMTVETSMQVGTSSGSDARSVLTTNGTFNAGELRLRSDGTLVTNGAVYVTEGARMHGGAEWVMTGTENKMTGLLNLESVGSSPVALSSGTANSTEGTTLLTLPGMISFAEAGWSNPDQAIFDLDGVTLDFSNGVMLTNLGFSVGEGDTITLASTNGGNGWYQATGSGDVLVQSGDIFYHGVLGYDSAQNVILTIEHEADFVHACTVNSGELVYIEMYQDAADPAWPYKAYVEAEYNNGWTGTSVESLAATDSLKQRYPSLLAFLNMQMQEGAHVYMGEDLVVAANGADYRADRHFGGNIQVLDTGDTAAYLHGEINEWGNWLLDGHLSGDGTLRLVSHNGSASIVSGSTSPKTTTTTENEITTTTEVSSETTVHGVSSTFTFTDMGTPDDWFTGTIGVEDPNGGIVQLNVGNVNIAGAGDVRWSQALIDLSHTGMKDPATGECDDADDATLVLGVQGNTTLRGIQGHGDSYVVSSRRQGSNQASHMVTLGEDSEADYKFEGTIGSGNYYLGGDAHTVVTTTITTVEDKSADTSNTRTETSTAQNNFYTSKEKGLSITKIGSNTQTFSGSAYLDAVDVQAGKLVFSGEADINSFRVGDGAVLQSNDISVDSVTLEGGSTWLTMQSEANSYDTLVYIENVFRDDGVHGITVGSSTGDQFVWRPAQNISMADAGTWTDGADAIFTLDNVTLHLDKPRVIVGLDGISGGSEIAMYSGVEGPYSFADNMVMVEDGQGNFYDADYKQVGNTIYLVLESTPSDYGIVVDGLTGYIWSGEDNGHTENDVHYINLTMGNVWRADGSAYNTGWHEQRAEGSANTDIGIYENGHTVYFRDTDVHGETEEHRLVDIRGKVAPGQIYVQADENLGHAGASNAEGQMWYGYAFVSTDGSGRITDFGDTPTSITKTGDALLVINTTNSFTGGVDVQDGGLYLAAPGAVGTGTLKFHTDQVWDMPIVDRDKSSQVFMERTGAELMICYPHSDEDASAFRGSSLINDIVLTSTQTEPGNDVAGNFKVSFAYSSFNAGATDHENVPRHWRNLTLSGALVGTGYEDASGNWVNTSANDTLELTGYSSTWNNVRDQSYVTVLTLNEDTATNDNYRTENGEIVNRFAGTVVLKNTINTSPLDSNTLSNRIAGTVQVVLKGDKLSEAELDMTRESVVSFKVYDENGGVITYEDPESGDPRQTYNNILVLNGDATVRGLSAKFQGKGYSFPEVGGNSGTVTRTYVSDMEQVDEVWHVRTLTAGLTNLRLGEYKDTDDTTYVYSGAMGFAQAYAGNAEAHIPYGDGFFEHTGEWYFDGHSMANTNLSVTKSSSSSQYIHTACLQDVSVYEGTLGFNNLELLGNMNLVGGSRLELGVTGDVGNERWDKSPESDNTLSAYEHKYTDDKVTVAAGKTLTVITPRPSGDEMLPRAAEVKGNLTLSEAANGKAAAALTFVVNGIIPAADDKNINTDDQNYMYPLLDVKGTFTLEDNTGITISFSGVDFSTESFSDKTYYLAAADDIVIGDDGDSSDFTSRVISLGYGYFGVLDTLDSSDPGLEITTGRDYLVMTVNGDPRRTWSGMVGLNGGNFVWDSTSTGNATGFDYRWKENLPFKNGQVVLFGNLYQPEKWTEDTTDLKSAETVQVIDTLHPGTTITQGETYTLGEGETAETRTFCIDSHEGAVAGYQKVLVQGEVAPAAVIINSDYQMKEGGVFIDTQDDTDYYFFGSGQIVDATVEELDRAGFDANWKTMLNKTGNGTAVIELDNRYTGGSVLQGGRVVMKHVNALGYVYNTDFNADDENNTDFDADDENSVLLTGNDCTITLMNGAMLQGDFDDRDFPGNHDESASTSQGNYMATTTIRNKVMVNVYADPSDPDYDALIDGVLINSHDKKLILRELAGEADTVLELSGVGLSAADSKAEFGRADMYRYGVFKVLDPGEFYGTVRMSGHEWGKSAADALGRVQLDIMSTSKSGEGADWTNATVDMTVAEGTERTVVALDITASGEVCELNSITGSIEQEGGSSSVLNMSKTNTVTLKLTGTRNGNYEGVLGYGDFQVVVDYGGYSEDEHHSTQHHFGASDHGALNLIKEGKGTTQTVRRAWLHDVEVTGGAFAVTEAMVAHDITTGGGQRVMVGQVDPATLYSLSVGKGGTLAMNTTFQISGAKTDAWAHVSAGSTAGDTTIGAAWVQLSDGATLSAREDWYTRTQVDIATDSHVTINTHNFAIDPYITAENDVFGKYEHAHIIQLLGKMVGRNVNLTVNNVLTNPAAKDAAVGTSDDSPYMGYVALNDLNAFTGSNTVNVEGMTVLQLLKDNNGVQGDVDITVEGRNATLQIVDNVTSYGSDNKASLSDTMQQYIHHLTFGANQYVPPEDDDPTTGNNDPLYRVNNGQLMLGGAEVTTLASDVTDRIQHPNMADMQVLISSRHNTTELKGEVSCLQVDLRGASVRLGGTESQSAEMKNTHIDIARETVSHTIHHTQLVNSLVHLQEDCSVNIADTVLVDRNSEVQGVVASYDAMTVNPEIGGLNPDGTISTGPHEAVGLVPTNNVEEVTTSMQTLVQMTFEDDSAETFVVGPTNTKILSLQTEQFTGVDVAGNGLTIQLHDDWSTHLKTGTRFVSVQIGGDSGHFLYEVENTSEMGSFAHLLDSQFVLQDKNGNQITGMWVTAAYVSNEVGSTVSPHLLYFALPIPESSTATLSLLALTALMGRRRRRQ